MTEYVKNLWQWFPLKVCGGLALTGMENQVWTVGAFFLLIFLDCFTRWLAISGAYLQGKGVEKPSLWEEIQALPAARRKGLICSSTMKRRGTQKLILYNICLITASAADFLISISFMDMKLVDMVMSYLAMTEFLSIVENLSDAGVASMEELLKRVRNE